MDVPGSLSAAPALAVIEPLVPTGWPATCCPCWLKACDWTRLFPNTTNSKQKPARHGCRRRGCLKPGWRRSTALLLGLSCCRRTWRPCCSVRAAAALAGPRVPCAASVMRAHERRPAAAGGSDPAWRGQGIGLQLWRQALDQARQMGWQAITCGPVVIGSEAAAFLARQGAHSQQRYITLVGRRGRSEVAAKKCLWTERGEAVSW